MTTNTVARLDKAMTHWCDGTYEYLKILDAIGASYVGLSISRRNSAALAEYFAIKGVTTIREAVALVKGGV